MTRPWDAARIAEVRALCAAATPGPWETRRRPELRAWATWSEYAGEFTANIERWSDSADRIDADFIAAARTALPEALDEIDRLNRRIAELEGLVSHTACTIDIWNDVDVDDEMEQVLVDTSAMLKAALGGDPAKDARDQPEILRHLPERTP